MRMKGRSEGLVKRSKAMIALKVVFLCCVYLAAFVDGSKGVKSLAIAPVSGQVSGQPRKLSKLSGSALRAFEYYGGIYKDTRLCSRHKEIFCLAYNEDKDYLELDKRRRNQLKFDVVSIGARDQTVGTNFDPKVGEFEAIEADDEESETLTGAVANDLRLTTVIKGTTYCVVRQVEVKDSTNLALPAVSLRPCNSIDSLENLGVGELKFSIVEQSRNDFTLAILPDDSDKFNDLKTPSCLTNTYTYRTKFGIPTRRKELHTGSFVALADCFTNSDEDKHRSQYAQEFQAVGYSYSKIERLEKVSLKESTSIIEEPRFGFFCLESREDLCLGVSLTNGTDLEDQKLVQIKNYTKNSVKGLDHLKIEWYKDGDLINGGTGRLKSAAEFDYCLEARYNISMGVNKRGVEFFDDILHLGLCDLEEDTRNGVPFETNNGNVVMSEKFDIVGKSTDIGSYFELQTRVPGTEKIRCASVIQCVTHDGEDFCSKYNSRPIFNSKDLVQGAYVRLKECDSYRMPSQRFFWTPDFEMTNPPTPTLAPTPELVTPRPTDVPVVRPTEIPSSSPIPRPSMAPTSYPTLATKIEDYEAERGEESEGKDEGGDGDKIIPDGEKDNRSDDETGLRVGFAFLGIILLAIAVVGAMLYYKSKNGFSKVPEDDETFIARV